MLEFFIFTEGRVGVMGLIIEWGTYVDVLVLLNSDLWKQQSRGYKKNNIHEEWNQKYFLGVMQFLVNNLFYAWNFIKTEFLGI